MELFMDTASCEQVKTQITQTQTQLEEQITSIQSAIDGMVDVTWKAPGANQFQGDFQQWSTQVKSVVSQLNDLSARLASEIAEWEQVAQRG